MRAVNERDAPLQNEDQRRAQRGERRRGQRLPVAPRGACGEASTVWLQRTRRPFSCFPKPDDPVQPPTWAPGNRSTLSCGLLYKMPRLRGNCALAYDAHHARPEISHDFPGYANPSAAQAAVPPGHSSGKSHTPDAGRQTLRAAAVTNMHDSQHSPAAALHS